MTEPILTRFNNEYEKNILFEPRTGDEMSKALQHKVPIHLYSELCKLAEKHGTSRLLSHLFKQSERNVILLQDPDDMSSGHWFCVQRNIPKKEIYFFSTYGGKPDIEKIAWIPEDDLRESNQFLNLFNDGLHTLQKHGWKIYYNDYKYQVPGDRTAVCGIYTVAFLRSNMNPDQFEEETKKLIEDGINPAVYYYEKYFL